MKNFFLCFNVCFFEGFGVLHGDLLEIKMTAVLDKKDFVFRFKILQFFFYITLTPPGLICIDLNCRISIKTNADSQQLLDLECYKTFW
jgi:hypothetical protein